MIKAFIFDLDGTLLNTIVTITHYVNLTLAYVGLSPISEEECKMFVGNGARKLITRALASRGVTDAETVERALLYYNSKYDADSLYLTSPYNGIPEMLGALSERGIRLAVLSNKPDSATKPIIAGFFPGLFDIVEGGRDGVPLKPDPHALKDIMEKLSVSESEVVYVGDTGVDMQTGKNAGVARTVGVSWGFRSRDELTSCGADVIYDSAADLLGEADG